MSLIKIDQAKKVKLAKEARVSKLRKLLVDSDYKVMSDYDKPNEDIKTQRQEWRDEIRELLK